jgi:hypothetical protein
MNQPTPTQQQVPSRPWQRLHEVLHRHRYVLAPVSLGLGVASYLLIQRSAALAQWLALLLLATWLFGILELVVPRRMRLPPGLWRFVTQQTHQEAFFFTLPFLIKTTSWQTGQAWFTGGVALAALCSMWDPLYFGQIVKRRWLYLGYHALAVYLVMLVALPILLQLTTTQTLMIASAAIALLAVPSLTEPPDQHGRSKGLWFFAGALWLAAVSWLGRSVIPPATLWVADAVITTEVDAERKAPGQALNWVPVAEAEQRGVFAFTPIVAPRGLRERVFHQWFENGKMVVSIPLQIAGGREEGYRAWTHKTGFSQESQRQWSVRVVTESGQLLGQLRFEVTPRSAYEAPERSPLAEEGEAAGGPQREQVDPGVVPGPQQLDEKRGAGDEVHHDEPDPAAPPVPDGALGQDELDGVEADGDESGEEVEPDDEGD